MTSPDLEQLERTLGNLTGGLDCMGAVLEDGDHTSPENDRLFWLMGVLKRDLEAAHDWHQSAYKAQHAAKTNAPVAVT